MLLDYIIFDRFGVGHQQPSMPGKHDACWCGNTVAEAVSLGCQYDDIAGDWFPEKCIDHGLLAEFTQAGPGPGGGWQYYKDRKGKEKIHTSNMSDYTISVGAYFATRRWHASHCLYNYLEKAVQVSATGEVDRRAIRRHRRAYNPLHRDSPRATCTSRSS